MIDHKLVKLGRTRPTAEQKRKAMPLLRYLTAPLPAAPESYDSTVDAFIAMFGNDTYGCCVVAGYANFLMICAKQEGRSLSISEQAVVDFYLKMTGGKDDGLVETDFLAVAGTNGIDLGGAEPEKVVWTSVPVHDLDAIKSLVSIFYAVYLGVSLPLSAQNESTWDIGADLEGNNAPGSWGGHCLLLAKFDSPSKKLGLVTWGAVQAATEAWFSTYCNEVYVLLDEARANAIGVNWDVLLADMAAAQALA